MHGVADRKEQIHVHISGAFNKVGLGKRFECLNLHSFAAHLKLNFSLRNFVAMPILMFANVQSKHVVNIVGVFQKSRGCVVCCFCFISQFQ